MAKAKLGTKWECYACGAKFYDFGKPEVICPQCGADQKNPTEDEKTRRTAEEEAEVEAQEVEEEDVDEDEDGEEEDEELEDELGDDDGRGIGLDEEGLEDEEEDEDDDYNEDDDYD